jgi:hypothetical protein
MDSNSAFAKEEDCFKRIRLLVREVQFECLSCICLDLLERTKLINLEKPKLGICCNTRIVNGLIPSSVDFLIACHQTQPVDLVEWCILVAFMNK